MDAVQDVRRPKRRIPRPIKSRDAAAPRSYAAVAAIAGRPESPPSTIATHVAEPTLDDDWVRRTPPAALILPPPPEFADTPTMEKTKPTPAPRGRLDSPPTSPNPHADQDPPPPPSRNAIPHLVVECLPNWTGHFRTIAGALGHTPNARAYGRGVIFSPKTSLEFETVQRCLIEAASKDSDISWHRSSLEIQTILRKQRRTPAQNNGVQKDTARPLAAAAPREAVPPPVAPEPAPRTMDARTPTPTPTPTRTPTPSPCAQEEVPLRRRRSRRRRAPRPPKLEPPPHPSNCLDRMVQAITSILTTGMAAYLHEKEAMPVRNTTRHWVNSQIWRTRAGGIPAQNTTPGKQLPRAPPG